MVSTSGILVADRRELEHETSAVRILALIAFSLILLTLFIVSFFFGFDDLSEQLFFLSALHIVLAPLATYAALRLGIFTWLALGGALLLFILDVAQWFLRAFFLPFTLLEFIFIIVNTVFIALDVLYLITIWRINDTDESQNNAIVDSDDFETRAAMKEQEANTLRLTALFGFIAVAFMLVFTLIFLGFGTTTRALTLFSVGHLILAPYAAFIAVIGDIWIAVMLLAGIGQLVLDSIQLVLRFSTLSGALITTLSVDSVFGVTFILINIGLLFVDLMYILASVGYLAASGWFGSARVNVGTTTLSFAQAQEKYDTHQQHGEGPWRVHRRRKNYTNEPLY